MLSHPFKNLCWTGICQSMHLLIFLLFVCYCFLLDWGQGSLEIQPRFIVHIKLTARGQDCSRCVPTWALRAHGACRGWLSRAMHHLFGLVLAQKDLSRAGDLFSLEDAEIEGSLSEALEQIRIISSAAVSEILSLIIFHEIKYSV